MLIVGPHVSSNVTCSSIFSHQSNTHGTHPASSPENLQKKKSQQNKAINSLTLNIQSSYLFKISHQNPRNFPLDFPFPYDKTVWEKMKSCTTTNPFLSFLLQRWNIIKNNNSSSGSSSYDCSLETSRFLRDYAVWEINAFLWISLITITCLLSHKLFKLFKLWTQASKIPGPPSPSFYGHFNSISKQSLTGNNKQLLLFFKNFA